MELRDYLHKKRISVKDFAAMCGYSRVSISSITNERRSPSVKLVRIIENLTEGEVNRYDLLKNCEELIEKV